MTTNMTENITDYDRLLASLETAEQRIEELHGILERKNAIIRLLSLGDLTNAEIYGDSDCPTP